MTSASPIELIRFHCPHCGKLMRAPSTKAGRKGPCARCGEKIEIPRIGIPPGDEAAGRPQESAASVGGDELIDGFSLSAPTKPVETLDDLKQYAESRELGKQRRRRTPLWMWALHLSIPLATGWFLLWYYGQVKSPRELLEQRREASDVNGGSAVQTER